MPADVMNHNRRRVDYTLARVELPDGQVLEGRFVWRRAGMGAMVRTPEVELHLVDASAEKLDTTGTRWRIDSPDGVWFVEWVDHSGCGCLGKRPPSRT